MKMQGSPSIQAASQSESMFAETNIAPATIKAAQTALGFMVTPLGASEKNVNLPVATDSKPVTTDSKSSVALSYDDRPVGGHKKKGSVDPFGT